MALELNIFCLDIIDRQPVPGCFGSGGATGTETYLDWLLHAWGQTVQVALLSLVVALLVGSLVGTMRRPSSASDDLLLYQRSER